MPIPEPKSKEAYEEYASNVAGMKREVEAAKRGTPGRSVKEAKAILEQNEKLLKSEIKVVEDAIKELKKQLKKFDQQNPSGDVLGENTEYLRKLNGNLKKFENGLDILKAKARPAPMMQSSQSQRATNVDSASAAHTERPLTASRRRQAEFDESAAAQHHASGYKTPKK